jgi:predicted RND superfamily exporter protein
MMDSESLRLVEDMEIYSHNLPHVGGAVTATDIVKRIFRMFHEGDPKWAILPEERAHLSQTFFLLGASMAPGELDRFISTPDYTNATVTIYFRDYNNQIIKDAISGLKKYIQEHPLDQMVFRLAGGILGILAAVNEEVEYSYWINMIAIFSLTYFLCVLTYRSFIAGMILILPLAFSQVLSDNFMIFKGIDMNINSLPIAAIGVGVGVDYGLYVLSRLAEEYRWQGNYQSAVYKTITTTGKAVIFTATALIGGICLWVFSDMKFQAEMGMLLCFLMFFNMVGSLLFIPAMVSLIGPERTVRNYRVD